MTLPAPSEIEVPKSLATVTAGGPIQSLIPNSLDGVWRMAQMISGSPFAPKDMKTPEACAAAIMLGLDIGIPPLQAVQSIAVINGRPNVWGDLALAICLAHPTCDSIDEEFEGKPDDVKTWTWICTAARKGRKPVRVVFTYDDAVRANLWNKEGPWRNYPKRMGQLRARAFALRDTFPDVLKGLAIREEVEDIDHGKGPAPKPGAPDPNIVDAEVREIPAGEQQPAKEPEKKPDPKPAETTAPKEDQKPKPDPKPKAADKKAETAKPAEAKKADQKPAETKGEQQQDEGGSDFPGDPNYKPPQDNAGGMKQEQGETYQGPALLGELETLFDGCESLESLDMVVTYQDDAKKKPTRGMVIVDSLNESDRKQAQSMYADAKARITKQMEQDAAAEQSRQNDGGDADETGEGQTADQGEQQDEKDPASMNAAEYDAYFRAFVDESEDKDELKKRWFGENDIRRALEQNEGWKGTNDLNLYRKAKIDKLSGVG